MSTFNKVSIVMPVYNGERYIAKSIEKVSLYMDKLGIPHEIIVVDDGSTDNMYEEAIANSKDGVRVVRYPVNKGKGYAFLYGALRSERENSIIRLRSGYWIYPSIK